jgi:hypothetical protein
MDDELQQLEAELRRLRPRNPSPQLQARVSAKLAPRGQSIWWWAALPLAAAVALAFASWFRPMDANAPVAPITQVAPKMDTVPDEYQPVAAENLLYATQDEGVVTLTSGAQARRVRNSYVDTITWRNPRTNASLRWSVPRDEVRVVPVNFQ